MIQKSLAHSLPKELQSGESCVHDTAASSALRSPLRMVMKVSGSRALNVPSPPPVGNPPKIATPFLSWNVSVRSGEVDVNEQGGVAHVAGVYVPSRTQISSPPVVTPIAS